MQHAVLRMLLISNLHYKQKIYHAVAIAELQKNTQQENQ